MLLDAETGMMDKTVLPMPQSRVSSDKIEKLKTTLRRVGCTFRESEQDQGSLEMWRIAKISKLSRFWSFMTGLPWCRGQNTSKIHEAQSMSYSELLRMPKSAARCRNATGLKFIFGCIFKLLVNDIKKLWNIEAGTWWKRRQNMTKAVLSTLQSGTADWKCSCDSTY